MPSIISYDKKLEGLNKEKRTLEDITFSCHFEINNNNSEIFLGVYFKKITENSKEFGFLEWKQ